MPMALALSLLNAMKRLTGFGVGIPPQLVWREGTWIVEQEFDLLGPRPFLNWGPSPVLERAGWTFAPMVYNANHYDQHVTTRLDNSPGEEWLLFNEPERPEQANMTPAEAADTTRRFLRDAWDAGNEFQWSAPGVWVGPDTHDGLAWATEYVQNLRRNGISRPTYWHVHGYRSTTLAQFNAGWARFKAWYNTWGSGAPIILSEICAEAAPLANQIAIMDRVAGMLRSSEISCAFWFSSHISDNSQWQSAALCTVDVVAQQVALTPLGQHFVGLASQPLAKRR